MTIAQEIEIAFKISDENRVSDAFIEMNSDLMWLKAEVDLITYVPSYMLWCLAYKEKNGNLVCDHTIHALAEYGRANNPENNYLNFKGICNAEQIHAVKNFLLWCDENLELCNKTQIKRSLKYWG